MIGEYLRLAPTDLERAVSDPDAFRESVEDLYGSEDPRLFDVDKAWNALALVLERAGVSDAVVYGDDEIPGADDWGYGPPRSLRPERVRELAGRLADVDPARVVAAVSPAELVAEETYPTGGWDDPETALWLVENLTGLARFFREAADAGMGMVVWIG